MGNALAWTKPRVEHWMKTVMLDQYQIEEGPIGERVQLRNGNSRRPWGYIVTDKNRPGMQFKGRTPKQACEQAGLTLMFISGYKGDK